MAYEKKYKVTVKGTAPLLMNRFVGAGTGKTASKKSGIQKDPQEEAMKALYTDDKGIVVQPATHFEGCLIKAATNFKIPGQGKKSFKDAFKGGILVEPENIPHKKQKYDIDIRSVVINRARVEKARPILKEWELEFNIQVIDERIEGAVLKDILVEAGKYFGVGDYRPKFGRFEVTSFKEV